VRLEHEDDRHLGEDRFRQIFVREQVDDEAPNAHPTQLEAGDPAEAACPCVRVQPAPVAAPQLPGVEHLGEDLALRVAQHDGERAPVGREALRKLDDAAKRERVEAARTVEQDPARAAARRAARPRDRRRPHRTLDRARVACARHGDERSGQRERDDGERFPRGTQAHVWAP